MAQLVSYSHRHKYCIAWMAIMIAIHHQKRRLSIFCSKKKILSAPRVRDFPL